MTPTASPPASRVLSDRSIVMLNYLLYPVTFSPNPVAHVDGVVELLVTGDQPHATRAELLECIDEVLAKSDWGAKVAAMGCQTEEGVKCFLVAVRRHLESTPLSLFERARLSKFPFLGWWVSLLRLVRR